MIAMLRYAYLKSLRDSSLIAFILIPAMFPVAALSGATLAKGHLRYPLYMNAQFSPAQNATRPDQFEVRPFFYLLTLVTDPTCPGTPTSAGLWHTLLARAPCGGEWLLASILTWGRSSYQHAPSGPGSWTPPGTPQRPTLTEASSPASRRIGSITAFPLLPARHPPSWRYPPSPRPRRLTPSSALL